MYLQFHSFCLRFSIGIFFLFVFGSQLKAQHPSKLNTELFRLLQKTPLEQQKTFQLPVLVKGDLVQISQQVKAIGGHYKYGVKNIASVYLSLQGIRKLAADKAVRRIEYQPAQAQFLEHRADSIMLENNRVQSVFYGSLPFHQPFRGTGVLLGIIDDGFEWKHPDFWMPDSSTRMLSLWDQNSADTRYPQRVYNYGAEWTKAAIDAYQCTHRALDHGTHVMGIAAGNALATGKYRGIAPKVNLAAVGIMSGDYFLSSFVDGLHYLFEQAAILGQPCVVNSSVGSYGSGHDGKDLYAQLVTALIEEREGRVLVQAAGNARQFPLHVGATLQNDTILTEFGYHQAANKTHFTCYADTAQWSGIRFSLALLEAQTGRQLAQTRTFQVGGNLQTVAGILHWSERLFLDAQGREVRLDIYVDQYEDVYATTIELSSPQNLGNWQLRTMGTGKYDIWSDEQHLGTSNILVKNKPYYQNPDTLQTIVGYWTCAAPVVVVGSYQNRKYIVNYTQDTVNVGTTAYPVGEISHFSSIGPTRTGLLKPDITASGGQVLSASSLTTLHANRQRTFSNRLDADGWHWLNRGTSMAAPIVAGAVALYLECQPYAHSSQVLQALQAATRVDVPVWRTMGTLPNVHWGYGKLDVEQLMYSCLVRGCMDSTAVNYNPWATFPDSNACQYSTKVSALSASYYWHCSPNPIQQIGQISYSLEEGTKGAFVLYNALGQLVWSSVITGTKGRISLERKNLPAGCYTLLFQPKQALNQAMTLGQSILLLP